MNTWHKVMGIFGLGQDPEVRYTPDGLAVATISCASDHAFKKDDEWQKQTEWTRMTSFGKMAERIGEYLRKGSQVYVEGRMVTQKWDDKEGVTRYSTGVTITKIDFLANFGNSEGGQSRPPEPPPAEEPPGFPSSKPSSGGSDDDIPF